MPRKVVVEPHNPRWAEFFKTESAGVAQALAPNVIAIHHIGSTAIPTVYAKPIIDMLIEVVDIEDVDTQNPAMAALGYTAMGEYGIPGRRYFRKDDATGRRTHHAHTFAAGSPEVERHLAFRDFMLAHAESAEPYSALKRQLAEAYPDDIDSYMDGKDGFIKDIDVQAAAWRARHGWRSRASASMVDPPGYGRSARFGAGHDGSQNHLAGRNPRDAQSRR